MIVSGRVTKEQVDWAKEHMPDRQQHMLFINELENVDMDEWPLGRKDWISRWTAAHVRYFAVFGEMPWS